MADPKYQAKFTVAVETSPRCKVCALPAHQRAELDDLLYKLSVGGELENGEKVTEKLLLEKCPEWFNLKVGKDSLYRHRRNHVRLVGPASGQAVDRVAVQEQALATLDDPNVDRFLQSVVAAAEARVLVDPSKVTLEQGIKAADALTRRGHDRESAMLMQTLAAGTAAALKTMARKEQGDVVESTVVEELEP